MVSRLIDRPIRPLFAEGFYNETQVIVTVLSHDLMNDPDVLAINAASAALALSGAPFLGPVGASRVGYINNEFVLNPNNEQMKESKLDLVVAGTREGVLMVESMAQELSEELMLDAVMFGWRGFQPVIDGILALKEKAGKESWYNANTALDKKALKAEMTALVGNDIRNAFAIKGKQERTIALKAAT